MGVSRFRAIMIWQIMFFCSILVMSGCGSNSSSDSSTVPFSAMTSPDGTGSSARFKLPSGITSDGTNLFVTDSGNHTVRKVVMASGVVTTVAGSKGIPGSTDETGTVAKFKSPNGIATDGSKLFIADSGNHTIRQMVIATGVVTTLAGTAGASGSVDGPGTTTARFNLPVGIVTDGTNLYVADSGNHAIRKVVIVSGAVTTLAGSIGVSGSTDGTGSSARFKSPYGIATDGTNLYVADSSNHTLRKIEIASGVVTTLAGTAGVNGATDGIGAVARFFSPFGIATDGSSLFVADSANHTLRRIVIESGAVTTLAGTALTGGSTDGVGPAALFRSPYASVVDGANLYVADRNNNVIRKVVIATGTVTTLAGSAQ